MSKDTHVSSWTGIDEHDVNVQYNAKTRSDRPKDRNQSEIRSLPAQTNKRRMNGAKQEGGRDR